MTFDHTKHALLHYCNYLFDCHNYQSSNTNYDITHDIFNGFSDDIFVTVYKSKVVVSKILIDHYQIIRNKKIKSLLK